MNWIRQDLRIAIYLRDGFTCLYCYRAKFRPSELQIDHIVPAASGERDDNRPENLATCCCDCNASKGTRTLAEFIGEGEADRVKTAARKPFDRGVAKAVLRSHGSARLAAEWMFFFRESGKPHGAEQDWR